MLHNVDYTLFFVSAATVESAAPVATTEMQLLPAVIADGEEEREEGETPLEEDGFRGR